jgi:hypothetical protein
MEKTRMVSKLLFIPLILIFFTSCATTANYEKILQTWVGSHADTLVASWGPPQSSYNLSSGGAVLEYKQQRNVQVGGYTYTSPETTYHSGNLNTYGNINTYGDLNTYGSYNSYGNYSGTSTRYVTKQTPVYNIPVSCTTRFTVSSSGIKRWSPKFGQSYKV